MQLCKHRKPECLRNAQTDVGAFPTLPNVDPTECLGLPEGRGSTKPRNLEIIAGRCDDREVGFDGSSYR